LLATAAILAACAMAPSRSVLPRVLGPSDERPHWLRDLQQPIERYPAPQGWGGDYLAQTGRAHHPSTAPTRAG
jgi:hypothetical protein